MHRLHRFVLDSGLRLLVIEAPHLHGAMVTAYLGVGSRHESPRVNGVSHFLEHMLFRGSERWPSSLTLNAAVEPYGGSLNAATTRDHTVYYTAVHPSGVGLALSVLGDMLIRPRLEGIELEREVILEEILDEVDERGRLIDAEALSKRQIFPGHPLGQPIAGPRDSVAAITRRDLSDHHRHFYCARNLVLAVAGPVDPEAIRDQAAAAFEDLPQGGTSTAEAAPPFPGGPRIELVSHRESQSELVLAFPTVAESHPDHMAGLALQRVLDDGLSSRLQQNVVERRGLAYDLSAGLEVFADTGVFSVEAASAHDRVPALVSALLETLGELATAPPSEDELARAKARYRFHAEMMQDSVGDLAGWYGEAELIHRPMDLAERVAQMEAVQPADVLRVARETFRLDRMAAVVVGSPPARATRRALEGSALGA